MADKGDSPGASAGAVVGGLVIVMLIFANFIDTNPFVTEYLYGPDSSLTLSFSAMVPNGIIETEKEVITKRITEIRQEPGGRILGTQKKRTVGYVLAGPVEAFDTVWWRMSYENPPSGWVNEKDISIYVGVIQFLNIIPIIYGKVLLLWIPFCILCLVALYYLKVKNEELEEFIAKKEKLESGEIDDSEKEEAHNESVGGSESLSMEAENNSTTGAAPVNLPTGNFNLKFSTPKNENHKSEKWEKIENLMKSHNTSDWNQAIIEADIILDDMLTNMGYAGNGIGEKLKNVEKADFVTLDDAWEAHKVRNRVAHQGSDFRMTKQEVERVLGLYKKVFEEFYYI